LNLLSLDSRQVRRELLLSPWVQDARVQKILPHELRISLVEREPYGIVLVPGRGYLWVDQEGYVLSVLSQPSVEPFISGITLASTPRGERLADATAIEILRQFYRLDGRALARLSELHWNGNSIALTSREGWQALLPPRDLSAHFELLQRVLSTLGMEQRSLPRWIDLRFDGEVTLRR
jgi:cell division septal protein FtsQ